MYSLLFSGQVYVINYQSYVLMYNLNMSFTLPQKNVSMNLSKYPRSILAQFRCGVLPTMVGTGKYQDEAS